MLPNADVNTKFVTEKDDCNHFPGDGRSSWNDCLIARNTNKRLKPEYVADVGLTVFTIRVRSSYEAVWRYELPRRISVEIGNYCTYSAQPGFEYELPIPTELLRE